MSLRSAPDERGVRTLFLAYFSFVGLFSPYFSLYLNEAGMTIVQIGVLMSLPQALRIVGPPFWGWLADRTGRRVALLRASALLALAATAALPWAAPSYPAVFALLAVLFFATAAQVPIAEAMALDIAGRDTGRYGRMRVWGSIGFVVAVLLAGPLLDGAGMATLPGWMAVLLVALLAATRSLPPLAPAAAARASVSVRRRLAEPRMVAFFASGFLMIFAHAALYAFFSLYLELHGYSKSAIGAIWGVGVVAEVIIFWVQRRLFDRFGALPLLVFSLAVCAVRFAIVGASDGWLPAILLSQLLHAVTFGVHHSATVALLQRWFEPAQQGRAQALNVTVGYGFGGTAGGLAAGWLWTQLSPAAAFWGAAAAGLAGLAAALWCARADEGRG